MKLAEFRTNIALLSQRELAELAELAESTIYAVEAGKSFSKLTRGKILNGLSQKVGRRVEASEIDEFAEHSAAL